MDKASTPKTCSCGKHIINSKKIRFVEYESRAKGWEHRQSHCNQFNTLFGFPFVEPRKKYQRGIDF